MLLTEPGRMIEVREQQPEKAPRLMLVTAGSSLGGAIGQTLARMRWRGVDEVSFAQAALIVSWDHCRVALDNRCS